MKYGMYSIRDFKTGFLSPTIDQNDASAMRNFEAAVMQSEQSLFFTHPADYALYRIGDYDSDTGELLPHVPAELLTASQVLDSAAARRVKEVVQND